MGSCVSVHKNPESAMKFRLSIGSKTKQLLIPSPTKEKPINGEHPVVDFGFKSQSSLSQPVTSLRDFGSKEEAFFDSQAWLESDCEDDFFSVNGDFTPSRGNTPNNQISFIGTPQRNKSPFMDRAPNTIAEPSPTNKKKKLLDLFRESFGGDEFSDDQNIANGKLEVEAAKPPLPPKSTNGTPYVSGANSICNNERTPNRDSKPEKERSSRTVQCCMPSLVPSRSSNESKKSLSPNQNGS